MQLKTSDVVSERQETVQQLNRILSTMHDILPLSYENRNTNSSELQRNLSFTEIFEKSERAELSYLKLINDNARTVKADLANAQCRSRSDDKDHHLLDERVWKKFYHWKTSPISERESLSIIDAVQLNRVKNHFSPYYHIESTLPRRYSNRMIPQYAVDLDFESSARIFPLNIAQDTSMSESSVLFLQNVKALSALSSLMDDAATEINVIENIVSSIEKKISIAFGAVGDSFEPVSSLHATIVSLQQMIQEKRIRFKVDQIIHEASSHMLKMETDHKLHLLNDSASSRALKQNLQGLFHRDGSKMAISTEMIVDSVISNVEHAHNLYLLAHEYSR